MKTVRQPLDAMQAVWNSTRNAQLAKGNEWIEALVSIPRIEAPFQIIISGLVSTRRRNRIDSMDGLPEFSARIALDDVELYPTRCRIVEMVESIEQTSSNDTLLVNETELAIANDDDEMSTNFTLCESKCNQSHSSMDPSNQHYRRSNCSCSASCLEVAKNCCSNYNSLCNGTSNNTISQYNSTSEVKESSLDSVGSASLSGSSAITVSEISTQSKSVTEINNKNTIPSDITTVRVDSFDSSEINTIPSTTSKVDPLATAPDNKNLSTEAAVSVSTEKAQSITSSPTLTLSSSLRVHPLPPSTVASDSTASTLEITLSSVSTTPFSSTSETTGFTSPLSSTNTQAYESSTPMRTVPFKTTTISSTSADTLLSSTSPGSTSHTMSTARHEPASTTKLSMQVSTTEAHITFVTRATTNAMLPVVEQTVTDTRTEPSSTNTISTKASTSSTTTTTTEAIPSNPKSYDESDITRQSFHENNIKDEISAQDRKVANSHLKLEATEAAPRIEAVAEATKLPMLKSVTGINSVTHFSSNDDVQRTPLPAIPVIRTHAKFAQQQEQHQQPQRAEKTSNRQNDVHERSNVTQHKRNWHVILLLAAGASFLVLTAVGVVRHLKLRNKRMRQDDLDIGLLAFN